MMQLWWDCVGGDLRIAHMKEEVGSAGDEEVHT
jgi:hypothetical protein